MLITNRKLCKESSLESIVRTACKSGFNIIQLREKNLPSRELLRLARSLRKITAQYSSLLFINDRLDIALLSKADGLHLPSEWQHYPPFTKGGKGGFLGKSVHSINEAIKAEKEKFDYIIFGPVFRTKSKIKYGRPQGLKMLKTVCDKVKIPVIAVGGITQERAVKCFQAGASGIAVMSGILSY